MQAPSSADFDSAFNPVTVTIGICYVHIVFSGVVVWWPFELATKYDSNLQVKFSKHETKSERV